MNSTCPACEAPLRPRATSCVCGWVLESVANPQVGIREYLQKRDAAEKDRLNAEAHAWCVSKGIARQEGESVTDWLHRTGVLKKLSALTR